MDGARDEVLAGAALARDQHRQVVALQPLNLFGDAVHRRARADEAGKQRLERPLVALFDGLRRALARAAQLEPLARHRGEHAQPPHGAVVSAARGATIVHERVAVVVRPSDSVSSRPLAVGAAALRRGARQRAGDGRHRSRRWRARARRRPASATNTTAASASRRLEQRRRRFARQQLGQDRRVHQPPDDGIVGVGGGRDRHGPSAPTSSSCARALDLVEIALRAERAEHTPWPGRDTARRPGACRLRREAAERQLAERRLVALARAARRRWRSARSRGARPTGGPARSCTSPRMRRNSPQLPGAARGSSRLSHVCQPRARPRRPGRPRRAPRRRRGRPESLRPAARPA